MKLMIEKEFVDKYTSKNYEVGKIVDFKDERASELLNDPRNLVSKVKEAVTPVEKVAKAIKKPVTKKSK